MTREPFHDPYDALSDEELDEHVAALFDGRTQRTVPVSIRWPEDLLARVKRVAEAAGVPYQALIKDLVAAALPLAERRRPAASSRRGASAARKVGTSRKPAGARSTSHRTR